MRFLLTILLGSLLVFTAGAQKTAKISAVVNGYNGRVVDFEFIDNPDNNMQYPYADGKRMEFEVELKEPSLMKLNRWTWVMVCPGDEIHAEVSYNGKNVKTTKFSGSEQAVLLNQTVQDARDTRVGIHYKMNPLAAVVTLVPVEKYYNMSLEQWKKESGMLEAIKGQVNEEAYHYIYSELEGIFLSNVVNYPFIDADVNKRAQAEIPSDYWNVLDGYRMRSDKASLKSFSYLNWLLTYKEYSDRRAAQQKGESFHLEGDLQKGFDSLTAFYDGEVLDAALYVYLYNAITKQQDFAKISQLAKTYYKKYNHTKSYKTTLQEMMK